MWRRKLDVRGPALRWLAEPRVKPKVLRETVRMLPREPTRFPQRFGPYVLIRLLAEGGMGQVYLGVTGTQEAKKLCVIKRIGSSPAPAMQLTELRARFKREAAIAMALSHATIVQTFNAGQEDGLYIVQEYVQGLSLQKLVSSARASADVIPVPVACHIALQVARALAYLHNFQSRGLVHRDVTPENIMLSSCGEVKLIDFGVTKPTAWGEGLTQAGTVFGKPNWVAPELLLGRSLDRRADLFSLGLVCWCVLTGRNPGPIMIEPTKWDLIFPPPSSYNPQVPPELDRIVTKVISYEPERRFQTAEELEDALAACAASGPSKERALAKLVARHMGLHQDAALAAEVEAACSLLDRARRAPPSRAASRPIKARSAWLSRGPSALALVLLGVVVLFMVVRAEPPVRPRSEPSSPVTAAHTVPVEPVRDVAAAPWDAGGPPRSAAGGPADPVRLPEPSPPAAPARPRKSPQVVAVEPADGERALGSALEALERSELASALDSAEQAARLGVGPRAWIVIGRIRAVQQDFEGAQAAFEEALRLDPDNGEARRRLEKLRSVPREGLL